MLLLNVLRIVIIIGNMKDKNANRNKMSSDRRNRVKNSKVHHHHDLGPYIVEDRRMLSRVAGDSSK